MASLDQMKELVRLAEQSKRSAKMSHFELVGEFHRVFDYPVRTETYIGVFDKDPKLLKSRVAFLREERDEFLQHYNSEPKNIPELADALCDLLYFAFGTGQCIGIDLDAEMQFLSIEMVRDLQITQNLHIVSDAEIMNRLSTITCYVDAFERACNSRDFGTMTMCLVSVIDKTYDLGYYMGFDMDPMFREVHRSNMTKVCTTERDAIESVQRYKMQGIYKQPVVRVKEPYFLVYDDHLNKILKSFYWDAPNLQQFIKTKIVIE
jgi:predicted HAD superfamily Cof-like phosphohydrolase